ncbi:MAG TPA: radical SAM protein [Acidimicrobiales bacterium]
MTPSILQVHPTLRCNLRCAHCYSGSEPGLTAALPVGALQAAAADAARLGYGVLAVSGGEPLLYDPLPDLLAAARDAGLATTMTTNGLLVGSRRFERCARSIGAVAVSVDGIGPTHDRMRGRRGAFAEVVERTAVLREAGIPFGLIVTLTEENWDQLEDVADLAVDRGASLLQVHPLERAGRGEGCDGLVPSAATLGRAFVVVAALRARLGARVHVQLDLLHRREVAERPDLVHATAPPEAARLGDWLTTLVVEDDGSVAPVAYGFGARYRVGNVLHGSLAAAARRWSATRQAAFVALCGRLRDRLLADDGWRLVNWTEAAVRASAGLPVSPAPAA